MQSHQTKRRRVVLSYSEGAARLDMSTSSFRRRVSEGHIKAIRLGPRRVGVTEDEIDRVIDEAEPAT